MVRGHGPSGLRFVGFGGLGRVRSMMVFYFEFGWSAVGGGV